MASLLPIKKKYAAAYLSRTFQFNSNCVMRVEFPVFSSLFGNDMCDTWYITVAVITHSAIQFEKKTFQCHFLQFSL